jgi:hypothetical protein
MIRPAVRWFGGLVAAIVFLLLPLPVLAQSTAAPARSTHARAQGDRDLLLRLDSVALLVPAGAVAPGAVVGLGAGGVPGGAGVIVTAAGGLHSEVAVLLSPNEADLAVIAAEGGTPALVDTTTGERRACLAAIRSGGEGRPRWIACPVARPGAYLLGGTPAPPSSDPLLAGALARIPPSAASTRPPAWALVLIIAAAAGLGAAGALLLGGRPRSP